MTLILQILSLLCALFLLSSILFCERPAPNDPQGPWPYLISLTFSVLSGVLLIIHTLRL